MGGPGSIHSTLTTNLVGRIKSQGIFHKIVKESSFLGGNAYEKRERTLTGWKKWQSRKRGRLDFGLVGGRGKLPKINEGAWWGSFFTNDEIAETLQFPIKVVGSGGVINRGGTG